MRFWRRYKTIILGTTAMAMLVGSAVYTFEVQWGVILRLLFYCLLMVATVIGLAALAAIGYTKLRERLFRSESGNTGRD